MLNHLAFAGMPGGYEVLIIGFVALLIFGNRLPTLMRFAGPRGGRVQEGDQRRRGRHQARRLIHST